MSHSESAQFQIEVFFDGGCPLCVREMNLLRRMDRNGQIRFTDIDAPDFDAAAYGKTREELMQRMHGRQPDGSWISGVEVFRQMYTAVGYERLVWMTRLPVVSQALDLAYTVFARNRLRLTGRCKDGVCAVPIRSSQSTQSHSPITESQRTT